MNCLFNLFCLFCFYCVLGFVPMVVLFKCCSISCWVVVCPCVVVHWCIFCAICGWSFLFCCCRNPFVRCLWFSYCVISCSMFIVISPLFVLFYHLLVISFCVCITCALAGSCSLVFLFSWFSYVFCLLGSCGCCCFSCCIFCGCWLVFWIGLLVLVLVLLV